MPSRHRDKVACPAEAKSDCPDCARAGPAFDTGCRACVVRHVAGYFRERRLAYYNEVRQQHGTDVGHAFAQDVIGAIKARSRVPILCPSPCASMPFHAGVMGQNGI